MSSSFFILSFLATVTICFPNSNFSNVTELDFTLDTENKKIGREMIQLTRYLNKVLNKSDDPKDNKTYVTCWTCHHGKVEPEHKRPIE